MKAIAEEGKRILVFAKGEKIVEGLARYASEHEITSAAISGIGALKDAELGYYRLSEKLYTRKTFEEDYELLALNGNITIKDGKPFVHVHTVLGDEAFNAFGGHLFEAVVAVTAEVILTPMDVTRVREMNDEIGLALICRAYDRAD